MPAATHYNPTDKDYRAAAVKERAERQAWHAKAWSYYYGDHPKPLRVRPGRPDNNVIINLVAQHADHTVSFAAPEFPRLELDAYADTEAEQLLERVWSAAGDAVWLTNVLLAGVLGGHVFARVLPSDHGLPRIVALNPSNVLVAWAEDDYELPLWYEVYYRAGRELRRIDFVAPDVAEPQDIDLGGGVFVRYTGGAWLIREWGQPIRSVGGQGDEWRLVGSSIWPYTMPPIIDWQHLPKPGSYYGQHELGGLTLNDAVNKVASDIKAILRVHAAPRRVAIGIPPDAIKDTAIDNFWAIDGKTPQDVSIQSLEMQSDLASSMAFMQFLAESYMQQARVTILTGGPDAYKNVTNLGIKAAFMSQLGKTETIHRLYGEGIARLSAAALEQLGLDPVEPEVVWKAALPISESEATQTAIMQVNAGFQSRQGAATALGIDYQRVLDQLRNEAFLIDALTPGATGGAFATDGGS